MTTFLLFVWVALVCVACLLCLAYLTAVLYLVASAWMGEEDD